MAAVFAFGARAQRGRAAEPATQPFPPFKIADQLYYVGASDYSSYLIVTKAGPDRHRRRRRADRASRWSATSGRWGSTRRTIKILLNTHEHFDHAAGLAEVKRAAAPDVKFYASAEDGAIVGGRRQGRSRS